MFSTRVLNPIPLRLAQAICDVICLDAPASFTREPSPELIACAANWGLPTPPTPNALEYKKDM